MHPQLLQPSLGDGTARSVASTTGRAMAVGQHLTAVVLTGVGVVRALGDGVAWPAVVGAGVAILAWYTAGVVLTKRRRTPRLAVLWLLGLALVWIAAVTVSSEFIWLAFLLWLLAGHLLPFVAGLCFSIVMFAVSVGAPVLQHGSVGYASVLGPLIGGVFAFGTSRGYLRLLRDAAERERLVASLKQAQREMTELQDELARAQRHSGALAERARISRDIHDTVAQALSSIRLLSHVGATRTVDAEAGRTLLQVEALAGDSLVDVRRIVAALAPAELERDALAAALERMCERMREETGIDAQLRVDGSLPALPTEVEVALMRTAQSALANVRLHANASSVVVSLIDAGDTVRLDLIDDGDGFDREAWERTAQASSSYGLRFMRSRLRELGGGLDIESSVGEGTALSAFAPLRAPLGAPTTQTEEESS